MVVQHNLQAMNANRMLSITTSSQSKATEKLSSGYKINRAADDAAGLTISEKMRKQIKGLNRASDNAQDGVSAVQTAEGALTEVHSMLQRMNELANQAANGTNSEDDRDAIQAEIEQLTTEIDRVAETTKFNETYLLKGDVNGNTSTQKVNAHDAGLAGKLVTNENGTASFALNKALETGDKVTIAGKEYTIGSTAKGSVLDPSTLNTSTAGYDVSTTLDGKNMAIGDSVTVDGKTYTLTDKVALNDITFAENGSSGVKSDDKGTTFTIGETTYVVAAQDANITQDKNGNDATAVTIAGAKKLIGEALGKEQQVKLIGNGDGTNAKAANNFIVSSLEDGEVSTIKAGSNTPTVGAFLPKATGNAAKTTLSAGESVTLSGETTIATAQSPESAKVTYDSINALTAGNTVKIGSGANAVTYTIVASDDKVDEDSYKLTKEMILSKIHDGDTVDVNGAGAKTVIGDIGNTSDSEDTITAKTAYEMMAKELAKASSIGADTAATVKNEGEGKFTITQGSVEVTNGLSFNLHVGADADMTNKITVDIDTMDAAGLGIKGINVADDNGSAATYAIDAISDAISKVSSQRSALGAVQNRLDHTISNLDNVAENTTSAESRIRDTDMAETMVEYSKNNILAQAGQSMLAQANQSTQGVLSLLG